MTRERKVENTLVDEDIKSICLIFLDLMQSKKPAGSTRFRAMATAPFCVGYTAAREFCHCTSGIQWNVQLLVVDVLVGLMALRKKKDIGEHCRPETKNKPEYM